MKYHAVLFDLDGTLLDTTDLIVASFMHTLDQYCPGRYTEKDILACLGEPLLDQMKRFGGEELAEAMVKTYREHNVAHHDDYVRAFPGVVEVIAGLFEAGVRLGVVSNKQRLTVEMGLALSRLDRYMSAVVCYGDTEKPKPDPAPVRLAMEQLNADDRRTLMVGDSRFDILAAKRAGIASAGVAWSNHAESLKELSPDVFLQNMFDLYDILELEPQRKGNRDEEDRKVSR